MRKSKHKPRETVHVALEVPLSEETYDQIRRRARTYGISMSTVASDAMRRLFRIANAEHLIGDEETLL